MNLFKFDGAPLLNWRGLAYALTCVVMVVSTFMMFALITWCLAGHGAGPTGPAPWWRHLLACLQCALFGKFGALVVVILVVPLLVVCRHIGVWALASLGVTRAQEESEASEEVDD